MRQNKYLWILKNSFWIYGVSLNTQYTIYDMVVGVIINVAISVPKRAIVYQPTKAC